MLGVWAWINSGNGEVSRYTNVKSDFQSPNFGFNQPVNNQTM